MSVTILGYGRSAESEFSFPEFISVEWGEGLSSLESISKAINQLGQRDDLHWYSPSLATRSRSQNAFELTRWSSLIQPVNRDLTIKLFNEKPFVAKLKSRAAPSFGVTRLPVKYFAQ